MPLDSGVSLFLVEDDPNIRYLLEVAALRAGIFGPIAVASDGLSAFAALRQTDAGSLPDFIVTDLSMPRMDGLELIRALKADPTLRQIPVGVITSSDLPEDRDAAFAAGASAFVRKPYGLHELTKALLLLHDSSVEAHVHLRSVG